MLVEIIRKEILLHLMGLRFAIASILCLTVILTSLFVRGINYTQNLDDYNQNTIMDRKALESVEWPFNLNWRPLKFHKKPNPMKIFVQGLDEQNGGTVCVFPDRIARFLVPDIRNTAVPLFPFADLVFFVGIIMSLMAIVFGYNAISGEKESGTLRLLLSYSVPRDRVLLGKWLGGYMTLVFPFLFSILGMVIILLPQKNISFTHAEWTRFALIILLSLLYIACIYSMALWISSITRRSSTSIIVLIALWVVLILALPNLSPYMANVLSPAYTMRDIDKTKRKILEDTFESMVETKLKAYDKEHGFEKEFWKKWDGMDPKNQIRGNYREMARSGWRRDARLHVVREYEKLDKELNNELDARVRLSKWLARFSPYSCLALGAMELSGEGVRERRRFIDQVNKFQNVFIRYLCDEENALRRRFIEIAGKFRAEPWSTLRKPIPRFVYQPAPAGTFIRPVILDAGILVMLCILFFMLSFVAFLRYDVR